jgi:hypothetical protein
MISANSLYPSFSFGFVEELRLYLDFFGSAPANWRNLAMVVAEGSFRLLFLLRRLGFVE